MPSLPRIRSRRAAPGAPVVETRPGPAELRAGGVTWVHLLSPTAGRRSFSPAASAGIRSTSRTSSRGASARRSTSTPTTRTASGYLFTVLHFPVYDAAVGRLNAGELDAFVGPDYLVTLPAVELRPVSLLFRRAEESEEFREQLLSRGSGRLFYEVLDDLYDYCFPILDKIGFKLEQIDEEIGAGDRARRSSSATSTRSSRRSSPTARSSSRSGRRSGSSNGRSSGSCRKSSSSTSTTSSTRPSGSGTCSTTTRKSWRRSRTRTSR